MMKVLHKGDFITTPFVVSNALTTTSRVNDDIIVLDTDTVFIDFFQTETKQDILFFMENSTIHFVPEKASSKNYTQNNPPLALEYVDYGAGKDINTLVI